ncbi:MAG: hypothetical protein ACFFBT_09805 [Promethearchaeota archaeon]
MVSNSISLKKKEIINVDEFLEKYQYLSNLDLKHILNLDFELDFYYKSEKICPIVKIAKPEDSEEIANIFKEIFRGTYPYKYLEDNKSIKDMIIHPNYEWFIFKSPANEIVGCFGADLELEEKRAFLHGFMIKRKYQKTIDVFKAFIGCITYLWKKYREKIFLWYGEMRTNEAISQFFTSLIGMKPIAFLPNKDIFCNRVESDILHAIYSKIVLNDYRFKEKPKIIRQVLNCYNYTNKRFQLGLPIVENPKIILDQEKIKIIKTLVSKKAEEDKFGFQKIKYSIKNTNSYFQFILNPYSKNIEKVEYSVSNLEELIVFLERLMELAKKQNLNYIECFVSSYKPKDQKVFLNAGFNPRGYVPCWRYNKSINFFEDYIVFNFFKGKIDQNMKIIPETEQFLNDINILEDKFKGESEIIRS